MEVEEQEGDVPEFSRVSVAGMPFAIEIVYGRPTVHHAKPQDSFLKDTVLDLALVLPLRTVYLLVHPVLCWSVGLLRAERYQSVLMRYARCSYSSSRSQRARSDIDKPSYLLILVLKFILGDIQNMYASR